MQRNQYIFLGLAVLLFASLYFGGTMVSNKPPKPSNDQHNAGASAPNAMNPTASVEPLSILQYIKDETFKINADGQSKLKGLNEALTKDDNAIHNKDLAEFWEKEKNLNIAAHYYKKAAFLENTEKSLTFAGNLFLAILQKTEEPEIRKWQSLEGIECLNKALELNPNNTDTKIALATCYTEGTGETMKGVTLLREITQSDSTNIPANIILGKLAIQSGQFDKAIKRLELVMSLRPKNTEAMYFLAEAYKGSGNKEKALALFERCKKEVNNPDFAKEIDEYIKTFK